MRPLLPSPAGLTTFALPEPGLCAEMQPSPPSLPSPHLPPPLQGSTLLFGAALSLVLTRKLGARPWAELVPQCLLIALFTAELWSLILPN